MKNAIIIHGMPSEAEYHEQGDKATQGHWMPWLKAQLETKGIETHLPEMPEPYAPDYEKWKAVFEQFPINEDTMLVGHSAGGGFLVKWLSENKVKVGKVVLVAPWVDPNHKWAHKMFTNLVIDENVAERTAGITEFISLDDDAEELETLRILKSKIKWLQVREFTDKGHFIEIHMHTKEFPELRDFLLA